jgi:hypothetical protein
VGYAEVLAPLREALELADRVCDRLSTRLRDRAARAALTVDAQHAPPAAKEASGYVCIVFGVHEAYELEVAGEGLPAMHTAASVGHVEVFAVMLLALALEVGEELHGQVVHPHGARAVSA